VSVAKYSGSNPLYRHGFLKVSSNKRYLSFGDGTPFLWMGDSAQMSQTNASYDDWRTYVRDRLAKHFTVLMISTARSFEGAPSKNTDGNLPFIGSGLSQWNPAYWQDHEQRVQFANENGIVVVVHRLFRPGAEFTNPSEAKIFARNVVARYSGNFVVFSPNYDVGMNTTADEQGIAVDQSTSRHLVFQHPGTRGGQPCNTDAMAYYDRNYVDFAAVQSGHNNGDSKRCAQQAREQMLCAWNHRPHKPVINIEAFYDGDRRSRDGTAFDARSLGYVSWLSGALGYSYGVYGIWNWIRCPDDSCWSIAMKRESSTQMKHIHDFFNAIEWWRIEPAHELNEASPGQALSPRARLLLRRSGVSSKCCFIESAASGWELDP
jgi:hypothetical protein